MKEEVCETGLRPAGDLIRRRALSPRDLTEALLSRINRLNPVLNAYITVCAESALDEARRAEQEIARGGYRGPLHGIPIALKDIIDVRGITTTANSRQLIGNVPDTDADIVRQLREAGAIILGKTNTFELAIGGPSPDLPFPLASNPWNLDGYTGGSSSGSAVAVAAGMAMAAIGTDSGGSVRNPAAHCGVVGLKPTFGRLSTAGILPLAPELDHVGIVAWTAEDAGLVLDALLGAEATALDDDGEWTCFDADDLVGVRIGAIAAWADRENGASADVARSFQQATELLRELGAEVVEIELSPLTDYTACLLGLLLRQVYLRYEKPLIERPDLFGQIFRDRVIMGAFVTEAEQAGAVVLAERLRAEMDEAFKQVDIMVAPSMLSTSLLADIPRHAMFRAPYVTAAWNITGHPAVSMRCGFGPDGLPIGIQFAGRRMRDRELVGISHLYERASRWHECRPQL